MGILISLELKCYNLSLGAPNEMIQILTKTRLIEIKFSRRKYEQIMAHVSPENFLSEGVSGRHKP